jgi:hypothetical protein
MPISIEAFISRYTFIFTCRIVIVFQSHISR